MSYEILKNYTIANLTIDTVDDKWRDSMQGSCHCDYCGFKNKPIFAIKGIYLDYESDICGLLCKKCLETFLKEQRER